MKYSPQNELTCSELQLISSALKYQLAEYEAEIKQSKERAKFLYEICDKDNQETLNSFKLLNAYKDYLRIISKEKNNLAEIQRKIKRQLGGQR